MESFDQTQISTWHDKWLPQDYSCKVQSPIPVVDEHAKVVELIDKEQGWWNLDLLHLIFNEDDFQAIVKLPVNMLSKLDKLIWRGTSIGQFSVRSAYHLQKSTCLVKWWYFLARPTKGNLEDTSIFTTTNKLKYFSEGLVLMPYLRSKICFIK